MEEKNVQNTPELSTEQMEQTAGGMGMMKLYFTCQDCKSTMPAFPTQEKPIVCPRCGGALSSKVLQEASGKPAGSEARKMDSPMEEGKRMENDLKKAALPDEGMEGVDGGGTVPDQFAGLDIPKLVEQPIRAAYEALTVLAESNKEFLEEIRKYGWHVKQ